VIILRKNSADKKSIVPLDLLLLSGSAVVNEAILTGES
jgi:magnesium-transporting ATPase (P-type)